MAKGKRYKQPMIRRTGGGYVATRRVCSENEKRFDRHFTRQFCEDAAILAVHKTFGAGEKRVVDFLADYYETMNEMANLTLEDAEGDRDLVYMKAKLDEALKPLLGENFRPYDERYGGK